MIDNKAVLATFILLLLLVAMHPIIAAEAVILDPVKPIMVKKQSPQVSVRLTSNPTTGYQWYLKRYDQRLIKPVGNRFVPPNTKLIGAPGQSEWQFTVNPQAFVAPHVMHIIFEYRRPWEQTAGQQRDVTIVTESN